MLKIQTTEYGFALFHDGRFVLSRDSIEGIREIAWKWAGLFGRETGKMVQYCEYVGSHY